MIRRDQAKGPVPSFGVFSLDLFGEWMQIKRMRRHSYLPEGSYINRPCMYLCK